MNVDSLYLTLSLLVLLTLRAAEYNTSIQILGVIAEGCGTFPGKGHRNLTCGLFRRKIVTFMMSKSRASLTAKDLFIVLYRQSRSIQIVVVRLIPLCRILTLFLRFERICCLHLQCDWITSSWLLKHLPERSPGYDVTPVLKAWNLMVLNCFNSV
jgi:hypothetical protein